MRKSIISYQLSISRTVKLTLLLVGLLLIIGTQWSTNAEATGLAQTADKRKLPDIEVFTTQKYSGWAGSGLGLDIELGEYNFLPQDDAVTLKGMPSLRINATGPVDSGGWWSALVAGPDWESYSIAPYMENGTLEFSVKGAVGNEQFSIALGDIVPGRNPQTVQSVPVPISEYITVSADWQRVSIPLSRFTFEDQSFNPNQFSSIGFAAINTSPLTFWLADIRFTTPDLEPSTPTIKINQNGYRTDGFKQAFVSGFPDELSADVGTPFTVRSISNNEAVFEGELELMAEVDLLVSGEKVLQADFSELNQTGDFYLSVDAFQIPDSSAFKIGEDVYGPLVADTMRYFYLQRAGIPIDAAHAGPFARGIGHPQDSQAQFRSGDLPPKDVSGGWYDAGDYGKYVNAGATAVSDLLWAYEFFPSQFPDNHLNIPESGNGVSDLLDEVRWELDWMLRMQDPESGGFYHMVQPTEDFTPDQAQGPRYIEDASHGQTNLRPTATTASAVAALAHASLVFEPIDSGYAQELLAAAELGYQYLENNPELVPPTDGPYADWDDSENRFWAATALYRVTGEEKYHDLIRDVYPTIRTTFESNDDNGYGVQDMGMVAWLSYAFSDNQDPEVAQFFEEQFGRWSNHMRNRWEASTWNHTLLDEDYYWGSNYVALTTPLVMYAGHVALEQNTGAAAAISQQAIDYLLGSNPLGFSYVSGYGDNSVKNLYSVMWSHDGIEEVPPGVLVGGPNAYSNPLFYSNYAGKRYIDGNSFWTLNEHTVYWNSALVFNAAMQSDQVSVVVPEPTPTPIPTDTPEPEPEANPTAEAEVEPVATEIAAAKVDETNEVEATTQPDADNQQIILAAVVGSLATLATLAVGFFIWRMFAKRES